MKDKVVDTAEAQDGEHHAASMCSVRCKKYAAVLLVLLLVVIGLCVGLAVGLTREHQTHPHNTTSALEALRSKYELPALTVGQGKPGDFASQAVGVRKEGDPIPALNTDIYHLGSNTKAMTASLLALLIQDGLLSWSSTLPDLLPGFNISSAHDDTTLEMLTAHRSGITDEYVQDIPFVESLYNMGAIEGRWALSNRSLASPPSQKLGSYNYANTNYVLAGLIVDVVSNISAESMLRSRIFTPLGITTAGFGPSPETSDTSVDNPWPHSPTPSGPAPLWQVPNSRRDNPPAFTTAGRVHIAPSDYNRFLQVHLAGAFAAGSDPLSNPDTNPLSLTSSSFTKLHQPYPDSNSSSQGYGYTYGAWIRRNYTAQGTPFTLIHDGSNMLNVAVALLDTNLDEAYIALTNVGGDGAMTATLDAVLAMRSGSISLLQ